jgi:hypothetical protein
MVMTSLTRIAAAAVLMTCGCYVSGGTTAPTDDAAPLDDSSTADVDGGGSAFDWIYGNVLSVSCGVGGCHSGYMSLDLTSGPDRAYQLLLHTSAIVPCTGLPDQPYRPFVVPGDPTGSPLYLKVTGTTCKGTQMPLNAAALPQEQIDAINSWIASGATR